MDHNDIKRAKDFNMVGEVKNVRDLRIERDLFIRKR